MWNWLKNLLNSAPEDFELDLDPPQKLNSVRIWGIAQGPYHKDDVPDYEGPEDTDAWMLLCKVEKDGQVSDEEFWFEDLEDVRAWQKHFASRIEPIEVQLG
jgi:hypothetical protein